MTLSLSHSHTHTHTHTHTHSSIGVRVDNTARRGTQNAPQFRQWNWNNREGEEKVLAVGPPQCSVAMAVVQCKTSDSEMRDSFFSFSLSLSLCAKVGTRRLEIKISIFVLLFLESVQFLFRSSAKIYMQSALVCLDIANRGARKTLLALTPNDLKSHSQRFAVSLHHENVNDCLMGGK